MTTETSKYDGHTPGPWHQCDGNDHIISDAQHMKVAQTSPIVVNNYATGKTQYSPKHKARKANGLLIADAPQILRERDEARAVVAKLPHTADGVPVLYGDWVFWLRPGGEEIVGVVVQESNPAADHRAKWRFHVPAYGMNAYDFEIYSTKEAAEAARDNA